MTVPPQIGIGVLIIMNIFVQCTILVVLLYCAVLMWPVCTVHVLQVHIQCHTCSPSVLAIFTHVYHTVI